ncbi:MAG: anti-sigma factor family protein [Planctomycetota bacterium]|jgi:anti-sigma factor RsiW
MTCQELAEFILEYVEGKLAEDARSTFEKHLEMCPSCIEYLKSYKTTQMVLDDLCCECRDEVPREVPEDLIQAILKARKAAES